MRSTILLPILALVVLWSSPGPASAQRVGGGPAAGALAVTGEVLARQVIDIVPGHPAGLEPALGLTRANRDQEQLGPLASFFLGAAIGGFGGFMICSAGSQGDDGAYVGLFMCAPAGAVLGGLVFLGLRGLR